MALSVGLGTLFDKSAPGSKASPTDVIEKETDISADEGVRWRPGILSIATVGEMVVS